MTPDLIFVALIVASTLLVAVYSLGRHVGAVRERDTINAHYHRYFASQKSFTLDHFIAQLMANRHWEDK